MKKINFRKIMLKTAAMLTGIMCLACSSQNVWANVTTSYGSGQIEIDNIEGQDTGFKAYKVFNAVKNSDGTLSDFSWPDNTVRNAVMSAIQRFDSSFISTSAQDAAEFISNAYMNASGQLTTDSSTILSYRELLNKIAAAIDDTSGAEQLTSGSSSVLSEGYWLLVTDGNYVGTDETGTSPIYAIVSSGNVTITEKTSVPTVDKKVLNDADGAEYSYGADSERGQSVKHKITGTVAKNIKTYSSYYYEFEDTMSAGIDYDIGSFKVTLDGEDVTSAFTESLNVNQDSTTKLSVKCDDILDISGTAVDADSVFVLTYTAKLNKNCVVGAAGNPNDVRIIYSSNPNTNEKSSTHTVRDYLYTFALHVEKKDRNTNVALKGAQFTIEATDPDDTASKNLYVQADGKLASTPYAWTTDENGVFTVDGLDAGTYTLHEVKTPEGYKVNNEDTVFTIEAGYDQNGTLLSMTNTVSENNDACAGIDNTLDKDSSGNDSNIVKGETGTGVEIAKCLANVTVGNTKMIAMPLSGQGGTAIFILGGFTIVAVSMVCVFCFRKKFSRRQRS